MAQCWLDNKFTEVWITMPGEVILFLGWQMKPKGLKLEEAKENVSKIPLDVDWAGMPAVVSAHVISLFAASTYVKMAWEYNKTLKKNASKMKQDCHHKKVPRNTNVNTAGSTSNQSTQTKVWVLSQNQKNDWIARWRVEWQDPHDFGTISGDVNPEELAVVAEEMAVVEDPMMSGTVIQNPSTLRMRMMFPPYTQTQHKGLTKVPDWPDQPCQEGKDDTGVGILASHHFPCLDKRRMRSRTTCGGATWWDWRITRPYNPLRGGHLDQVVEDLDWHFGFSTNYDSMMSELYKIALWWAEVV